MKKKGISETKQKGRSTKAPMSTRYQKNTRREKEVNFQNSPLKKNLTLKGGILDQKRSSNGAAAAGEGFPTNKKSSKDETMKNKAGKAFRLKSYGGDLFSTNKSGDGEGLIYKMRMQWQIEDEDDSVGVGLNRLSGLGGPNDEIEETQSIKTDDVRSESTLSGSTTKKKKIACSLATLAAKPEKRQILVQDGVMTALLRLSQEESLEVKFYCAQTMENLSMDRNLRAKLITDGIVPLVSALAQSHPSRKTTVCLARCLVNLTTTEGMESRIIFDGGAAAIQILYSSSLRVMEHALSSLYNLTAVKDKYPRMEEANVIILQICVFSLPEFLETKMLKCILNLSGIRGSQVMLIEGGCISLISRVVYKQRNNEHHRLCAKILYNLTSSEVARAKMDSDDIPQLLLKLLDIEDEESRLEATQTVTRLAQNQLGRNLLVGIGAVEVLKKNCLKPSNSFLVAARLTASAFCSLSTSKHTAHEMSGKGAMASMVNLVQRTWQTDGGDEAICLDFTQCVYNMMRYGDLQRILGPLSRQGALHCLLQVGNMCHPIISRWVSLCLTILSALKSCLDYLSVADLSATLARMVQLDCKFVRARVVVAIWYLSERETLEEEILKMIEALVTILQDAKNSGDNDTELTGNCIAVLSKLATNHQLYRKMLELDGLMYVMHFSQSPVLETRLNCAAMLSMLTSRKEFWQRMPLAELIDTLEKLGVMEDMGTQQRITISFFQLSIQDSAREELLNQRVEEVLKRMSGRPNEWIRRGCAAALNNMAYHPGAERQLIRKRNDDDVTVVSVLLVLAMVSSDTFKTKHICFKAIFNLMSEPAIHDTLRQEQLIWAMTELVELALTETSPDGVDLLLLCATAFCNLATNSTPLFRREITSSASKRAIFKLLQFDEPNISKLALKALFNILNSEWKKRFGRNATPTYREQKEVAVKLGPLCMDFIPHARSLLIAAANDNDPENETLVLQMLYLASQKEDCHASIMEHGPLRAVDIARLKGRNGLCLIYAMMLCNMAQDEDVRCTLCNEGCTSWLAQLYSRANPKITPIIACALYALSTSPENILTMVAEDVIPLLCKLRLKDRRTCLYVSKCLFNISTEDSVCERMVNQDIMRPLGALFHIRPNFEFSERAINTIKEECALTVYNLTVGKINSKKLVSQGATKLLSFLAQEDGVCIDSTQRCSAAMRNLICVSGNIADMIKDGVIDALVHLSNSTDAVTRHNCITSLRNMTYVQSAREMLVSTGAIDIIMKESDLFGEDLDDDTASNQGGVGLADELNLSNRLLCEIEAESWGNARSVQQPSKAAPLRRSPQNLDLLNECQWTEQLDAGDCEVPWTKVLVTEEECQMQPPELKATESITKLSDHSSVDSSLSKEKLNDVHTLDFERIDLADSKNSISSIHREGDPDQRTYDIKEEELNKAPTRNVDNDYLETLSKDSSPRRKSSSLNDMGQMLELSIKGVMSERDIDLNYSESEEFDPLQSPHERMNSRGKPMFPNIDVGRDYPDSSGPSTPTSPMESFRKHKTDGSLNTKHGKLSKKNWRNGGRNASHSSASVTWKPPLLGSITPPPSQNLIPISLPALSGPNSQSGKRTSSPKRSRSRKSSSRQSHRGKLHDSIEKGVSHY